MPKPYIYTKLTAYSILYKDPLSVLTTVFTVLGTGIDDKAFHKRKDGYYMDFDPSTPIVPVKGLYPHSKDERFQPYQNFVGLDGVRGNFKEAMEYFLKCIESTTPEQYLNHYNWKDVAVMGGKDAVLSELQTWKDYVPVIRQMYGIRK